MKSLLIAHKKTVILAEMNGPVKNNHNTIIKEFEEECKVGRRKPTVPTPEQRMIIKKSGYDPYDYRVLWDDGNYIMIVRRGVGGSIKIER